MPVNPTYPGVYIEEVPSGVRTIRGVATSTAAFIGSFHRGLLDEAVQLFSLADFEREYGGLDRNSETGYSIQQFFLNGGTEAWVVRVADTQTGAGDPTPTNANSASVIFGSQPGIAAVTGAGATIDPDVAQVFVGGGAFDTSSNDGSYTINGVDIGFQQDDDLDAVRDSINTALANADVDIEASHDGTRLTLAAGSAATAIDLGGPDLGDVGLDSALASSDEQVNLLTQGAVAQDETLTIQVSGSSQLTIIFGTGPDQVATLEQLQAALGGLNGGNASVDGSGNISITDGNDSITVGGTADVTAFGLTAGVTTPTLGDEVFRVRAGRRIRGESAQNPGSWGNSLRVEVDYDTADPALLFNLTIQLVRIDGERTVVVQTEAFRNLTMEPDTPNNALEVVNQGSKLVQLDRTGMPALVPPAPGNSWLRPASNGTLGGALPSPAAIPAQDAAFNVTLPGGPAVATTMDYAGATPTTYAQLRPFVEAAIRRAAQSNSVPDARKPVLAGATVSLLGDGQSGNPFRFFVRLGRAAQPFDPATTLSLAGPAVGAGANGIRLNAANAVINAQLNSLAGGRDGQPPAAGTTHRPIPVDFFRGQASAKTGLYALEDVDLFNILCIPEATTMTANDMASLYTEAEAYVRERRAMLIVDIPAAVRNLDQMQTWLSDNAGLRDPNAAVYYPRSQVPDPLNRNRLRSLPNSGTIAGLWARTDADRGVWKAPAGTEARLRNVMMLDYNLTDQENGVLNPLGVNCLRTFPVYASICWGARTLDGADVIASDFKYIPVRRITLFIEESLYRGTQWVVFEPNDEPLWAQIRLNVGAFMHDLFRKGAFQGTSPREAYFVKCDKETTTQTDIDNGIVNIEVGFAPLKPAEFVILKIQQIARQAAA